MLAISTSRTLSRGAGPHRQSTSLAREGHCGPRLPRSLCARRANVRRPACRSTLSEATCQDEPRLVIFRASNNFAPNISCYFVRAFVDHLISHRLSTRTPLVTGRWTPATVIRCDVQSTAPKSPVISLLSLPLQN